MPKIAFIGAGSEVFATKLIGDILSYPELADSTLALMDIDENRLARTARIAEGMVENGGVDATIESTTDRREALSEADYVLTMFYAGWDAFENEIRIPQKYGVSQAIGNILNPSGVFAALRQIPVMLDVAADMKELCPGAPLLNYTNPVPTINWTVDEATDVDIYGLCHSVPGTAEQLAEYLNVPADELEYWVAGTNHMAWFLELRHDGRDLYPDLHEAMEEPDIYRQDTVRFEMMRYFEAFVTESSAHMSEYVPYFRTDEECIEELTGTGMAERMPTAYYLEQRLGERPRGWSDRVNEDEAAIERSHEYGSRLIHSMETDTTRRMNLNVRNDGAISNLQDDGCVEVPCLVDGSGVHSCNVGDLPPQLAALNRSNLNIYERTVTGALERDRTAVHQAVKLDPLTAAACTLEEIHEMTEEIFEANAEYLPEFN